MRGRLSAALQINLGSHRICLLEAAMAFGSHVHPFCELQLCYAALWGELAVDGGSWERWLQLSTEDCLPACTGHV